MSNGVDRMEGQNGQSTPVMPIDARCSLLYPGIDPVGKYSIIDMAFAYRLARVKAVLQFRAPNVRRFVKDMLDTFETDPGLIRAKEDMIRAARDHRSIEEEAARTEESAGLRARARALETSEAVEKYSCLISGLEYAVGIKPKHTFAAVRNTYWDTMQIPPDFSRVEEYVDTMDRAATEYEVEFQNFDNILRLRASNALSPSWEDAISSVSPYARSTVSLLLDPLFEKTRHDGRRNFQIDLITVNGVTVRELLYSQYLLERERDPRYTFREFLREDNLHQSTHEIVAAALMAGKRVELFIPDKSGNIPETPVQLLKTGYTAPVERVTLNAWERFFSKWGFFKEKTAKALDYERTMEARRRVQVYNTCANIRTDTPADKSVQKAFFPEAAGDSSEHTSMTTLALCAMFADGYTLERAADPTDLSDEKRRYADMVRERMERGGDEWKAEILAAGTRKLARMFNEYGSSLDFSNANTFRSPKARPLFFAASLATQIKEELGSCVDEFEELAEREDERYGDDPRAYIEKRCDGICAFMAPISSSLDCQARLMFGERRQTRIAVSAVATEKFHLNIVKKAHAENERKPLWALANSDVVKAFSHNLERDKAFGEYVRQVYNSPEKTEEVVRDMANGTYSKQLHIRANMQTGDMVFGGVERAENAEYRNALQEREDVTAEVEVQKPKPPTRSR